MKIAKLEQLIDMQDKKRAAEKRKSEQEDEKFRQKTAAFWRNEKRLVPEKQTLVERIISWRDSFVKTGAFRKLSGETVIFYGPWGHELPRYGNGCWSRVYLEKTGSLKYAAGYKWMGGRGFLAEGDFAQKLSCDYLKALAGHLESGEVYETIAGEVKQSLKPS